MLGALVPLQPLWSLKGFVWGPTFSKYGFNTVLTLCIHPPGPSVDFKGLFAVASSELCASEEPLEQVSPPDTLRFSCDTASSHIISASSSSKRACKGRFILLCKGCDA